jgi:hypothetical protein
MTMKSQSKVVLPNEIDISGSEYFGIEVKRDIQEILQTAPGVYFERLEYLREANLAKVYYTGWAPSLHRCQYCIKVDLSGKNNKFDKIKHIFSIAVKIAEKQKDRAIYAIKYGIVSPLPVMEGQKLEKRHLSVDRSLPALIKMTGDNFISDLDDMMREVLSQVQDEDQDYIFNGNGHVILCGLGIFVGHSVWLHRGKDGYILDDGANLRIKADIPEMTISSLVGRKLQDLCEIHPDYNDRIISKIKKDGSVIQISLIPETMPLTRFFDL